MHIMLYLLEIRLIELSRNILRILELILLLFATIYMPICYLEKLDSDWHI